MKLPSLLILGVLLVAATAPSAPAAPVRNLVQNGSFEMDWMHNAVTSNTRFLLLDQSDWGYGQADAQPDLWVLPESARSDTSVARFGRASLRLTGDAWQVIYVCGQTQTQDGGGGYNPFTPLAPELAQQVRQQPVRFGAWCKTADAADGASLAVTLEYVVGGKITPRNVEVPYSKGTHDWEHKEIEVAPDAALGALHAAVVHLVHRGEGTAWFDGAAAEEVQTPGTAPEPNLLFNGNFATHEGDAVTGWSKPQLWNWVRRDYYRFTGWSHEDGKIAGEVSLMNATEVGPALRMTVAPGGNFALASRPIDLKQDKPRPLRVEAQLWADNLRWVELMAKDERGEWLPQQDFSGAWGTDVNYRNRIVGAGSHDWEYVSKYFAPVRPVSQLTLYLCVRGFDGKLMQRNLVGTARFADVQLHECGTSTDELRRRGVALPRNEQPAHPSQAATSISGEQTASSGTPASPLIVRLGSICAYPDESIPVGINFRVTKASLQQLGRCRVFVKSPQGEKTLLETDAPTASFWKPDDVRPLLLREGHVDARRLITLDIKSAGLPIHPAADPLRDSTLVVEVKDRAGKLVFSQTSEPFGFMQRPAPPALPERISRSFVDPHGAIRVNDRPFFFHPFPIGAPGATDLGGVSPTLNLPAGYKLLSLPFPKDLVFAAAAENEWREKVRTFIAANKSDSKLLGYRFAHDGETMMWFDRWKEMADCQRKVAGWAREVDPDHVILGAEWLFGTGTLTPDSAKHFDFLDALEVEPAFTWVPDFKTIRQQSARGQYLLAGMECYYYQSPALLRWRMYSLLRGGASDVGICPSNMLTPRPETVSFLRDLYAEEARLEPMMAADAPAQPAACSNPAVSLWERATSDERYVVVMGAGKDAPGEQPYEIKLPAEVTRVEVLFEGREVSCKDGRFSDALENGTSVHVYRARVK